ncbi:MAG: Protein phosphatase methylesterase 1 [Pycnora praestabilis]|nr:MAG: Protein phosphatase methylesterase 1 [Pycnora praestabilis]
MSDLQRSFIKAKLASLPMEAPMLPGSMEGEEELDAFTELRSDIPDDDSSSASSTSSTGTIRPIQSKELFARPQSTSAERPAYEQLPWSNYFSQELYIERKTADGLLTQHVYITLPISSGPLFVTHHGAGSSGLSFAALALELRKALPEAGVLSLDARGHGGTVIHSDTAQGEERGQRLDLSLRTLGNDMLDVIRHVQAKFEWADLPGLILVGHSLGGAVVTDVAKGGHLSDRVLGYAVLDVVEGSAIDALQSMQTYLSTRPSGFPSISSAIEWHIRSRTLRNLSSARVSVPSLLLHTPFASNTDSRSVPHRDWSWRTDLAATQPFWENWFIGLSKKFLEAKGGKLLLLAGTDRLDKDLMIGQMQGVFMDIAFATLESFRNTLKADISNSLTGRYQLQVFPEAGHFIHEDLPERTAMILVDFLRRNDRSALVLPPKVGDILKKKQHVSNP